LVSDVTESRRSEEDLRRVQERMQAILEHTPASIWVKDESGRIVLANHRLADALGHPYGDVIGRRS
jgi:PAS domain S-box-containing protein